MLEGKNLMEAKRQEAIRAGRSFDGAYGFSFSIAVGLVLFVTGLILAVFLGEGQWGVGLLFGVPLLIAGLIVPLFTMKDVFKRTDVHGACPACGTDIHTTDTTVRLECPHCTQPIKIRDTNFSKVE